jgi:hypothetical protein
VIVDVLCVHYVLSICCVGAMLVQWLPRLADWGREVPICCVMCVACKQLLQSCHAVYCMSPRVPLCDGPPFSLTLPQMVAQGCTVGAPCAWHVVTICVLGTL